MEAEERKGAGEDQSAEAVKVKKRSVEEALRREMEEQVCTCFIRTFAMTFTDAR